MAILDYLSQLTKKKREDEQGQEKQLFAPIAPPNMSNVMGGKTVMGDSVVPVGLQTAEYKAPVRRQSGDELGAATAAFAKNLSAVAPPTTETKTGETKTGETTQATAKDLPSGSGLGINTSVVDQTAPVKTDTTTTKEGAVTPKIEQGVKPGMASNVGTVSDVVKDQKPEGQTSVGQTGGDEKKPEAPTVIGTSGNDKITIKRTDAGYDVTVGATTKSIADPDLGKLGTNIQTTFGLTAAPRMSSLPTIRQALGDQPLISTIDIGGGQTGTIYRDPKGNFAVYNKAGQDVTANISPDALNRTYQQENIATRTDFSADYATDSKNQEAVGTVNLASIAPVVSSTGQSVLMETAVVQRGDSYYIVPLNISNGDRSSLITQEQAEKNLDTNNIHLGKYKTEAAALLDADRLKERLNTGAINVRQKEVSEALNKELSRPYDPNDQNDISSKIKTIDGKNIEVFARGNQLRDVKTGAVVDPTTINTTDSTRALQRAAIARMPIDTPDNRLAKARASAAFAQQEYVDATTGKINDKTHNLWDVLRGIGYGALKGFFTGGLGGALAGGVEGGIHAGFDKTYDDRLRNELWRIPRATEKLKIAQAGLTASQAEVANIRENVKGQFEILKLRSDAELAATKSVEEFLKRPGGAYDKATKLGFLTQEDINAMRAEMVAKFGPDALKQYPINLKPGNLTKLEKDVDSSGRRIWTNPMNGISVPGQIVGKDGKTTDITYSRLAENEFNVIIGGKPYTFKGTEQQLSTIMSRLLQFSVGQEVNIAKFNASEQNKAEAAFVNDVNSRQQALATLTAKASEIFGANTAKANTYATAANEIAKLQKEADALKDKKGKSDRTKYLDLLGKIATLSIDAAKNLPENYEGQDEQIRMAIETLRAAPIRYSPKLLDPSKFNIQLIPNPAAVPPGEAGSNYTEPDEKDPAIDSEIGMRRRRPARATTTA